MAIEYEPVIGLEVHCELKTATKLFCGCKTTFGNEANTQVCPVCLGLPGTLPVMNEKAVEFAVKIGQALNCTISKYSKMDRKNYYYPDLPKAYQISQYDKPLNYGGHLDITLKEGTKRIGITRAHLEEDAGKLVHAGGKAGRLDSSDYSLADYNRGGIPLVEIVSEPDIRSADEAYAYLTALKNILLYIDVSDCNMEEGSLRCDANVSVRPKGEAKFGTKAEIKNMNSFRFAKQAIEYEIKAPDRLAGKGRAGDPGIPLMGRDRKQDQAHALQGRSPRLPLFPRAGPGAHRPERRLCPENQGQPARIARRQTGPVCLTKYGLTAYDAGVLTAEQELAHWFEEGAKHTKSPKGLANWIMGDMAAKMKEQEKELKDLKFDQKKLCELVDLVEAGTINSKQAKEVFAEMFDAGISPAEVVKSRGMAQVSDPKAIESAVDKVLAENPNVVADYKGGKQGVIGFLVGKVMQASQGKANPKMVNEVLKKKLNS